MEQREHNVIFMPLNEEGDFFSECCYHNQRYFTDKMPLFTTTILLLLLLQLLLVREAPFLKLTACMMI